MKMWLNSENQYFDGQGMFSKYIPMIEATDGLTLSQVCSLTGLSGSTIQNWVKRKFVSHPVEKKYRARQLARILLIASLRDCIKIERIGALMAMVNGDTEDTGDDIISEEQMYDYLCEVITAAENRAVFANEIPGIVESVTAEYIPPNSDARERLVGALTVMALGYIAGKYKQAAEEKFEQLGI